jgi:hypothetical protein
MSEQDIMKGNVKLSVFSSFDYQKLKSICDVICDLGYDCEFVENGNIVFQEKKDDE